MTSLARTRLDRVREDLDKLEDSLHLEDGLDVLVQFVGLDDRRFFSIDFSKVQNPARRWEVAVFIGPDWTHPKAEWVGTDGWLKSHGPSTRVAVDRLILQLAEVTQKEAHP